jgi:hypothetical protein
MSRTARFWLGTLYDWVVPEELPGGCTWLRGQQETCPTTGRLHHQVIAGFIQPVRRTAVIRIIGAGHWEATKSAAADEYVWKDATRVAGTQFELGGKPLRRNVATDWDAIRRAAKLGDLDGVPADVYVRYYGALTRIAADHAITPAIERSVSVFWGPTGTGKSKLAWEEAGLSAYCKDPRSKW